MAERRMQSHPKVRAWDYYAGQALAAFMGTIAAPTVLEISEEQRKTYDLAVAHAAYIADRVLAERSKRVATFELDDRQTDYQEGLR